LNSIKSKRLLYESTEIKHGLKCNINENSSELQFVFNEIDQKTRNLKKLEEEINKRRMKLVEKERSFKNKLLKYNNTKNKPKSSGKIKNQLIIDTKTYQENTDSKIINDISECYVILQRGILKNVTRSFADLLNYNVGDLIEKSLLELIDSEGLTEVRNYYLSRLKGCKNSNYTTILSTKHNKKIQVEMIIQPTIFNNEKADIAFVHKL